MTNEDLKKQFCAISGMDEEELNQKLVEHEKKRQLEFTTQVFNDVQKAKLDVERLQGVTNQQEELMSEVTTTMNANTSDLETLTDRFNRLERAFAEVPSFIGVYVIGIICSFLSGLIVYCLLK